jgi:hypothetical protein
MGELGRDWLRGVGVFPSRDCVWQRFSAKIRVRCVWRPALVLTGAPFPPSWQPLFMLLDFSLRHTVSLSKQCALHHCCFCLAIVFHNFARLFAHIVSFYVSPSFALAHCCVFLCVAAFVSVHNLGAGCDPVLQWGHCVDARPGCQHVRPRVPGCCRGH